MITSQWAGTLELGKEWNDAIQHLGNAASYRGRVHHLKRLAFQFMCQKAQGVHLTLTDDALVVIQMRSGGRRRRRQNTTG